MQLVEADGETGCGQPSFLLPSGIESPVENHGVPPPVPEVISRVLSTMVPVMLHFAIGRLGHLAAAGD